MSDDPRRDHDPHKGVGGADAANKAARNVNPEKSGIRSGNPQLDPDHARKHPSSPASDGNPQRK